MQIIFFLCCIKIKQKKNLESRNLTHGRYFEMLRNTLRYPEVFDVLIFEFLL